MDPARVARFGPNRDETAHGGALQCPRCGRYTARGGRPAHTCPAPALITIGPELRQVLTALQHAGGRSRLVGGCVRDAILGIPSKDIDIEVYGRELAELEAALQGIPGAHVDTVGASFGVVTVRIGDEAFDVAIPRRDSKTGDGHRGFSVAADHTLDETDATARRDFTINSMMWDPADGTLIDPHGGLIDLDARLLRHTSPAFAEDPLRVMRGVQFAGRFGMSLDPDTIELCRQLHGTIGELPVERIQGEWSKIATKATAPSLSLAALKTTGWQSHFPQIAAIDEVAQDARWHPEGTVDVHVGQVADAAARIAERDGLTGRDREVLVYAAIGHDFGKATHTQIHADGRVTAHGHAEAGVEPARNFLTGIGCPGEIVDRVAPLVAEHMCVASVGPDGPTASAVRKLARRLGPESIEMWARVVEADHAGRGAASNSGPAGDWVQLARNLNVGDRPAQPLVGGRDLIARGMKPGPAFRTILDAAQTAQDLGEFDASSAQEWLDGHLAASD